MTLNPCIIVSFIVIFIGAVLEMEVVSEERRAQLLGKRALKVCMVYFVRYVCNSLSFLWLYFVWHKLLHIIL